MARRTPREKKCCCCKKITIVNPTEGQAVIVGQHVFVDSTNGHDSGPDVGLRERLDRPFATLPAALAAAQSGDTVAMQPGDYPLAGTTELPALTSLTIEGWGGADEVRILCPDSYALQITGAQVYERLTLRSFSLVSTVAGAAILRVDAAAPQFAVPGSNAGLLVENVRGGAIHVRSAGIVEILDSDLRGPRATTLIAATSLAKLTDVVCTALELYYLDDIFFDDRPGPFGRQGYYFANVEAEMLFGAGTLLCAFDEDCRVGANASFTTINSLQPPLDASIQFRGKAAGTTNSFANGQIVADTPPNFGTIAMFIFHVGHNPNTGQARPWQNTFGSDYRSGFDLSGAIFYQPLLLFIEDLPLPAQQPPALPLDPRVFFFGAVGAQFLSHVVFLPFYDQDPPGEPYPFQMTQCEFGCPTLPEPTSPPAASTENVYVISQLSNINARGTDQRLLRYLEANTTPTDPQVYSYTVDRDVITLSVPNDSGATVSTPIAPPLPASALAAGSGIFANISIRSTFPATLSSFIESVTDTTVTTYSASDTGTSDVVLNRKAA